MIGQVIEQPHGLYRACILLFSRLSAVMFTVPRCACVIASAVLASSTMVYAPTRIHVGLPEWCKWQVHAMCAQVSAE